MDQEMHEAPHYQAAYDDTSWDRKPMSPNRAASAMLTTSPGHRGLAPCKEFISSLGSPQDLPPCRCWISVLSYSELEDFCSRVWRLV